MPKNPKFKKTLLQEGHPALKVMDDYEAELAKMKEEDREFHRMMRLRHESLAARAKIQMHEVMGTEPADGDWGFETDHRKDLGFVVALPQEPEEDEHPLARLLGGVLGGKRPKDDDEDDKPSLKSCLH